MTDPVGPYAIGSDNWPGMSKVIEESGELGQVIGKIIAVGGATAHWDGSDLHERFREERADVLAALLFMSDLNPRLLDEARVQAKRALFHRWQQEQQRSDLISGAPGSPGLQGTVEPNSSPAQDPSREDLLAVLRLCISDPGSVRPRGGTVLVDGHVQDDPDWPLDWDNRPKYESVPAWAAQAVADVLDPRLTAAHLAGQAKTLKNIPDRYRDGYEAGRAASARELDAQVAATRQVGEFLQHERLSAFHVREQLAATEAALARVDALHQPEQRYKDARDLVCSFCVGSDEEPVEWPCLTASALALPTGDVPGAAPVQAEPDPQPVNGNRDGDKGIPAKTNATPALPTSHRRTTS